MGLTRRLLIKKPYYSRIEDKIIEIFDENRAEDISVYLDEATRSQLAIDNENNAYKSQ